MARMILLYAVITFYFWMASIGNAVNNDVFGFIECTIAALVSLRLFVIECDK
jgi:hypothetical protein